jgi:NAD(P)-dependent dehydrogenase (short-subunit alcohol dehydrogenase family)
MTNRTWLITGCSSGFGRALAQVLLERGERVVITARRPEALTDLLRGHAPRVIALGLDITDERQVEAAVSSALQRFGAIDVLVNNAGYGCVGTVEDTSPALARALMDTNYFGTLAMIRAVLPHMVRRRSGQIVNIGSVAGQIGFPLLAYYCASKFAVAGMSESLAAELRPLGIRVTLAELGPYATGFTKSMAVNAPAAHYDPAALALVAGNAGWGRGEDPVTGVQSLLNAIDASEPPVRIILGPHGVDVVALHESRRATERQAWLPVSRGQNSGADRD